MAIYNEEMLIGAAEAAERGYNIERIRNAYKMAEKAHEGQLRDSGEPYITHPIASAMTLIGLGLDTDAICAALLHDVVEDTDITLDQLKKEFGAEVSSMVDGVTKLGKIPYSTREEEQAENLRKMLLAMSNDIRVMIIKLADRLHNIRTIAAKPPQKRREYARETMDVFVPIAHRLGIRALKEEMEDLAIRELDPIGYHEIEESLSLKKGEGTQFLEMIISTIKERFHEEGKDYHTEGRVKSVFGIYRKMYMQGKEFDEIYDIYAIRIIVDTVTECYNVLGMVHDMFTPIPNRFKDYVSTPKPNMYQSLHTTVIDKHQIPFEIQIRTWDMHRTAEFGVAAHWKYKAGVNKGDSMEERLTWVRQILESQQTENAEELLTSIKTDLSPEEVFIFTPKGDVKILPADSTPIDFAYAIHSGVGNHMVGCKVDGKIAQLDTKLQTGQIVEIITTKDENHGPSRDWISIAKTSEARSKIRAWFKKESREENIQRGKESFEAELRRAMLRIPPDRYDEYLDVISKKQHMASVDDFFATIGFGGLSVSNMMPRIKDEYNRMFDQPEGPVITLSENKHSKNGGVVVEGIDSVLVKFAHCCNPVPGDQIIGYITRGYGVSIHKADCENIRAFMENDEQNERIVKAYWESGVSEKFKGALEIISENRTGMLADVSVQLANMRIQISDFNARERKDGLAEFLITVEIYDTEQLDNVMNQLKKINGVLSVTRKTK